MIELHVNAVLKYMIPNIKANLVVRTSFLKTHVTFIHIFGIVLSKRITCVPKLT